jgi:hypothetical protein
MTLKMKAFGILAGLALAQAASAQQISKPLSSLASGSPMGKILCRDGLNVPLTADPEQSLPLRVVAQLHCGQEVLLLSGNEGYTINVHTLDGKSGYVAWMNVAKSEAGSAKSAILPSAPIHDGIAKWTPGAAGSDKFYSDDVIVESLTANGVTVQVSLEDTGWKLLSHVAVSNNSQNTVNIVPSRLSLSDKGQTIKSLAYQDPNKLKTAYTHEILWTRAEALPNDTAYLATADHQVAATSNTKNYLAPHQEEVRAVKAEFNPHAQTNSVSLNATTLQPDQQIAGSTWFQRSGKRQDLVLRVPVGDVVYEFPFSFNHTK